MPKLKNPEKRIGILTPSSNTSLESICTHLLEEADCAAHYSRFKVQSLSLDPEDLRQFTLEKMLPAAKLLADAKVDLIAWCGTAGSWLGVENERRLCDEILKETGIRAVTATLAQLSAFKHYNSRKVGLVVPYEENLTNKIIANFSSWGFPVTSERHLGQRVNTLFGKVPQEEIKSMIYEVSSNADSVCVFCTNFSIANDAEEIEQKIRLPVFDSISVTLWASLQTLGLTKGLNGWGRLLGENPPLS
jgi:maleate isomerase